MHSSLKGSTHTNFSPKKVISFVGNMQHNVMQILAHINCRCGCRYGEFQDILVIFADKINKLRKQRDSYRSQYTEEVKQLKAEKQVLQREILTLQQELKHMKTQTEDQSHTFFHNKSHHEEQNPYDSFNQVFKLQTQMSTSSLERELLKVGKQTSTSAEKLIQKYNIGYDELEHIIEEYVQDQENSFQNQEERKLYRLGKKLQKDVWMKKVKKDVQMLTNVRNKDY